MGKHTVMRTMVAMDTPKRALYCLTSLLTKQTHEVKGEGGGAWGYEPRKTTSNAIPRTPYPPP